MHKQFGLLTNLQKTAGAEKPLGQWNQYEITCRGNHILIKLNGYQTVELIDNDKKDRTLEGILVAVGLSLLVLIYQANHPPVYEVGRKPGTDMYRATVDHPDDETVSGLLVLRTEGSLHFASSPRALEKMRALILEREPQVVLLECSAIPDIEYTALQKLAAGEEKLREAGIELWLAGLNPVPLATVRRSPLAETLGDERMFQDIVQAVEAYEQRFDQGAPED